MLDLVGRKFNRLLVVKYSGNKNGLRIWTCKCDCGATKQVPTKSLRDGHIQSCGCYKAEMIKTAHLTHGMSKLPEYNVWGVMKNRCLSKKNKNYKHYGGRGIKICKRWLKFENFISDMGRRPSSKHSIDRFPNKDGDYEPSNCRWATVNQQLRNHRRNVWIEHNGIKMIRADWAAKLGISSSTLKNRLSILGWDKNTALTTRSCKK